MAHDFLNAALRGCTLDDVVLDNCRVLDSMLEAVNATTLNARASTWRDSRVEGGRLGALIAHDAAMTRVELTDCKLDYVNLRAARIDDVTFAKCTIGELDLTGASAQSVSFAGGTIETVRLGDTTLKDVDFSEVALNRVEGVGSLRGAIVSESQLLELAPSLADLLGIVVKP